MQATPDELHQALGKAREMREAGTDDHFLAKALLSEHARLENWMRVISAVKLYLRSGMATTEHARLVKIMHEVEAAEQRADKDSDFGLE